MSKLLIHSLLYKWYSVHHRALPWRETEDPYAIWLSEVILQQTRVAQGLEYYRRFLARWPRVEDLAAADEAEVLREWQGLGYYSRARNLHKAAQQIVANAQDGEGSVFPRTFEQIRALPGVGEYTAGAIASFAYNMPYPAMDGNVYRVVARLLDLDEPFDTTAGKKLFHARMEELLDRANPRLFNSAIMEFGALHCTPVLGDACIECPLQQQCLGFAHHTAELLPVRKPRAKVRDRWFTYHIYLSPSAIPPQSAEEQQGIVTLIRRRENAKDIWFHLYEFPCEESFSPESGPTAQRSGSVAVAETERSVSGAVAETEPVCTLTHVLSHQKIHARFMVHKVQKMPDIPGTFLIRWEELNDFALSRLTLRALDTIQHTV